MHQNEVSTTHKGMCDVLHETTETERHKLKQNHSKIRATLAISKINLISHNEKQKAITYCYMLMSLLYIKTCTCILSSNGSMLLLLNTKVCNINCLWDSIAIPAGWVAGMNLHSWVKRSVVPKNNMQWPWPRAQILSTWPRVQNTNRWGYGACHPMNIKYVI